MDGNQTLESLLQSVQNLSAAQIWLLISILVFLICAVLTIITFRQFGRTQGNLKDTPDLRRPEAILIDADKVTPFEKYTITDKPVMIGRIEAHDSKLYDSIVVPEVTVGRQHAVIEYEDGAYWLQDQGSVNGSYVNGRRVQDRQQLKDGDRIRIHKYTFRFVEHTMPVINPLEETIETLESIPPFSTVLDPQTVTPNAVLADHHEKTIYEVPDTWMSQPSQTEEHQRTQVLYKNELEASFTSLQAKSKGKADEELRKDIQEMTVQLFRSPNDDKTVRLYSDLLDGPPEIRPEFSSPEKPADFSLVSQIPDIDEKVAEALGEFFSDTQDDLRLPDHLELTGKGDQMARIGHFSAASPEHSTTVDEKTGKK